MKVAWLASAEHDVNNLTDYIALDNPRTALQIFTTIRISVKRLETFPSLGRTGRVAETRELVIPHFPYIVVYTIDDYIKILAVLHTSKKWPENFTS